MALDSSEIQSLPATVLCIFPCHSSATAGWNIDQSHPAQEQWVLEFCKHVYGMTPESKSAHPGSSKVVHSDQDLQGSVTADLTVPAARKGKINLLPSLGSSSDVLSQAELPWIIPSWSQAGSALSQDWTM